MLVNNTVLKLCVNKLKELLHYQLENSQNIKIPGVFSFIFFYLPYLWLLYNHFNWLDFAGSLEVRLVNDKDECSGRVEVRHGEVWQTVCDADWTLSKAEVVCELLECGRAVNALSGAHFGQGSGSVVEASHTCFDNLTALQQCSLKGFRAATCGHDHDAGVLCAGKAF